jgi:Tfp pilus assembly protein PilF
MAAFPAGTRAKLQQIIPVQLIVHVYIDGYQNPAGTNLTVQLLDDFGSLEKEAHTDNSGMVHFQTKTVTKGLTKQLRIFGPGVKEYGEAVEIESVEVHKTVNVVVRSDPSGVPASRNSSDLGSIAANRLKVPEKAEKELQKGKAAEAQKNWEEARKHFEAAIAAYPDYDVAYNGLGQALANAGDATAARTAFEKAIKINDNFAMAYRNLARISLSERKFDEMDNLLTRSLSSDPLNAWALAYAAYAELQLHKFDGAIDHARKAHSVPHEGLASIHIVAARALEEKQQPAEAASEYRMYLQEDPTGRDSERARKAIARLSGAPPN